MKPYNREYHELIDAKEAVKIAYKYHNHFISDSHTCKRIIDAFYAEIPAEDRRADPYFYTIFLSVTIYHAGRIQGKREERARRKASQSREEVTE